MNKIKLILHHPATIFTMKTYFSTLAILLGLLWFYGFKNPEGAKFIYNEF
ncbi:cytochrome C [Listeria monocytogenes]|nr:cytochrome C [Listeria monocytogenes]